MDITSWIISLVLTFLIFGAIGVTSKGFKTKRSKNYNPPPGPKPWPIIGNLHILGSNPHRALDSLAKRYGEIMQLKFGSSPVVIASSPEMAEQFLRVHDGTFASRPVTAAGKYTSYNCHDILWAPYGPYWRQARRIYLTEIFNPRRLESYEYIRSEEEKAFMSRLYSLRGKPVLLKDQLFRYTLTSISRIVFSNEYFSSDSGNPSLTLEELQDLIEKWFMLNGVLNIGDWIPWLRRFDLQGFVKEMKEFKKRVDKFHNLVIDDHKAKMENDKNFVPKDMVDVLLQLAKDPNLKVKLDEDCVKGLIQDLLTGSTDTTATSIEWAMYELLRNPHVLEKATEELDRIIGRDRWVEEKDISKLPYLDAILKETARLRPLATLLPPHYAIEDCNVTGYDIAKGTIVLINIWSIGRNPKFWDAPEEFLPERFLGKDIEVNGKSFHLLPFGSGRRICPGYALGWKIIKKTLANLLHGFKWRLPDGNNSEDIDMEEEYGVASHPRVRLSLVFEPRFPSQFY